MLKSISPGLLISYLLCLIPLIIWSLQEPLIQRFSYPLAIMSSVGQITGLIGMVLFSITLIISARTKEIESLFGGLNKVYKVHGSFGKYAYLLLLIHPLILAIRSSQGSLLDIVLYLFPGKFWTAQVGIAAFIGLTVLIILTLYVKIPYDKWHFTHKFMGLVYITAAVHTFYAPSDVRFNLILKIYMLALVAVAVGCYFYRTVLGSLLVKKYIYVIKSCREIAHNTLEMDLKAVGESLNFIPGQFVFLEFKTKGLSHEQHPFSIDSAPPGDELILTIKSLGDFTSKLVNIAPGTRVYVEGPYGNFTNKALHANIDQIWIAGGTGIAPFLSLLQDIANEKRQIYLFYTTHDASDVVYKAQLEETAKLFKHFHLYIFDSHTRGHFKAETIVREVGSLQNKDFLLCGPIPMMSDIKGQLIRAGIPSEFIHDEEFGFR